MSQKHWLTLLQVIAHWSIKQEIQSEICHGFFVVDSLAIQVSKNKSKNLHFKAFNQTVHISSINVTRGPNTALLHLKGSHTKKVAVV